MQNETYFHDEIFFPVQLPSFAETLAHLEQFGEPDGFGEVQYGPNGAYWVEGSFEISPRGLGTPRSQQYPAQSNSLLRE